MKRIRLERFSIGGGRGGGGGGPLFFIMGPCVIESERTTLKTLEGLLNISSSLRFPLIFKSSYDKANRTSLRSFRGPGLKKGLKILKKAKKEFPDVPILTDVHCKTEVKPASEVVDILQIPAFLCRQTDLIREAARTGLPVNIKKGQFMAPADIRHSIEKAERYGCREIIVTERGVSFGYNNLVVDFRSLPVMRAFGYPVVFDATHSVQSPAGLGASSGGDRRMARYLARAAAAVGVDGFFMEVHPDPESALCDGPNSLALKDVKRIVEELIEIDESVRALGPLR